MPVRERERERQFLELNILISCYRTVSFLAGFF